MNRRSLSLGARSVLRVALLGGMACASGACNNLDTTPVDVPKGTLGDDLYGLFCDRVGASVLTEDLSGASYESICHYDAKGHYGNRVDTSVLPKSTGAGIKARAQAVAKLETMVAHRTELIQGFNAAFPDVKIADAVKGKGTIRLHDALMDFSQRLAPLYDENPFIKNTDPLIPASTRALGRLFDALGGHPAPANGKDPADPALEALQKMAARHGYRPFNVALGAIRPALAYPRLRELTQASLGVLGPTGVASPELQQLLAVSKQELLTSRPSLEKLPVVRVDAATAQPNRPRSNLEVLQAMMLTQSDAFAASPNDPSRYLTRRDGRGFAVPVGSSPGIPGTIKAPFADTDGDGYADIDGFGRFVDASGKPLVLASPFTIPGQPKMGEVDAYGRPVSALYDYLDTSRTMLAAVARDLVPLLDAKVESTGPNAWRLEHETMMYAMAGAYDLYGGREAAQYDYAAELAGAANPIRSANAQCSGCLPYTRFVGEKSPFADLAHATGQILADPDSDALLLGVLDLIQNHEQEVARLVGALLKIRAISAQHDAAAHNGAEPFAELAYQVPIWDEMAQIIQRIVKRPGLTTQLLGALANPAAVTPHGTSMHEGDTMSAFFRNKDFLTYDPNNLNGPALNTTVGGASTSDPQVAVDWTKPQASNPNPAQDNRSIMQRSFQVIHDADHAALCNKQNAYVEAVIPLLGIGAEWPCGDQCFACNDLDICASPYDECELFKIDNAAVFYLDTLLPINHQKRSVMPINSQTALSDIISFAGGLGLDVPSLLAGSSNIDGLTLDCPDVSNSDSGCPSPQAINRLLYFGADSRTFPNLPDHDSVNDDLSWDGSEWVPNNPPTNTDNFVANMIEPASTVVCATDGLGVQQCSQASDTYRVRDFGSMFAWERLGYYDYLEPMVEVFADQSCNADGSVCDTTDLSGEQIFVDLFEVLWRHWPGPEHGPECNTQGSAATNNKYCSAAGVNKYEPILADSFTTDLIPALNEFAIAATQLSSITVARGPHAGEVWSGAEVLEKVTRILFDQSYAAQMGVTDRQGNASTTWTDGTPQAQATPFTLFADALHGIDTAFANACSCVGLSGKDFAACQSNAQACKLDTEIRQGQWKRARSQIVDEFFTVDGQGAAAQFHNPSTTKALVTIVNVLREQLNANCPNRESTGTCNWARHDLGEKVSQVISGPLFAGIMNVQEQVRANDPARRELEQMLTFILQSASQDDAFQSSLASFDDILQILADDTRFSPIFNAVATASAPQDDKGGAGCADTAINVLDALSSNTYDRYHVLDTVMPALVTPVDGGTGPTPIEIFMDTIADVNRIDATDDGPPMDVDDYRAVWETMNSFMTDKTRGLEQFYTIIQRRPRE